MKEISIVIPVYNSVRSLDELSKRLVTTLDEMKISYEIVFINDGSHDGSLEKLIELKSLNNNMIIVDLKKNYGQQNALMAGFQYCSGEYVVTIDDDLQNPPEEIPKLYGKILQGYDVVYGSYLKKKDKLYKKIGSRLFRSLNHKIFNINKEIKYSSYRIMKKDIVDEIKDVKTAFPYISGMIVSTTSNVSNEIITHEKRKYGKTNYNFSKLLSLSYNLLINYSSIPLKVVSYLGLFISIISFIIGTIFIIQKLLIGQAPPGWTSLIVLMSFYTSILLLLLFFVGEYLSRILKEISNRSAYSIKKVMK